MLRDCNNILATGNYVGMKLTSGEEILCKVGEIGDTVKLIRPHFIAQTPQGVVLSPWPQLVNHESESSHTIEVPKQFIMATYALRDDFAAEMKEIMGDGPKILVPNKKIIT
jgi:hypothetical protein